MLLGVSLLVFLNQIVEHGKGVFPIGPPSRPHHGPAAEKAEQEVSETADGQQERHRLARQPISKETDRVECGDKAHQTAEREGDQAQGDAITVAAKNLGERCQQPSDQRAGNAGDEDEQRQFKIDHSHGL